MQHIILLEEKNNGLSNSDPRNSLKMHVQKSNGIEETGLFGLRVKVTINFHVDP